MKPATIAAVVIIPVLAGLFYLGQPEADSITTEELKKEMAAPPDFPDEVPQTLSKDKKYAVDVSLHTRQEILELLKNTARVFHGPKPEGSEPTISLVLHGPEIEFFTIRNYDKNKDIVDLAARLKAYRHVEIKMCQTMMQEKGLTINDIPAFIEIVPYGPDELKRLIQNGYIYL